MTCGRPVFRGSGGPVSSAGMVIREWSVLFRASTVSGRKQRRGEGPAGVRGQWPGATPLVGLPGRSPAPGRQQDPNAGGQAGLERPRPSALLRWVVSLQQLLSCWAGKRRLEDGAQGGGPTSARVASERLHQAWWPLSARSSVGTAEARAVPCALTDFAPCLGQGLRLQGQQPGATARTSSLCG